MSRIGPMDSTRAYYTTLYNAKQVAEAFEEIDKWNYSDHGEFQAGISNYLGSNYGPEHMKELYAVYFEKWKFRFGKYKAKSNCTQKEFDFQ